MLTAFVQFNNKECKNCGRLVLCCRSSAEAGSRSQSIPPARHGGRPFLPAEFSLEVSDRNSCQIKGLERAVFSLRPFPTDLQSTAVWLLWEITVRSRSFATRFLRSSRARAPVFLGTCYIEVGSRTLNHEDRVPLSLSGALPSICCPA